MKIQSFKNWLVLLVLALVVGLEQKNQAFGQCPPPIAALTGSVLDSYVQAYPNYPNSPAHFLVTVQNANQPLPAGSYLGWCVDETVNINSSYDAPGTFFSGLLYPTCDPNLNTYLPPGHTPTTYVSPAVWQQVNYILNHKNGAFYWAVQVAIFDLVGGPAGASPPYPLYNQSEVDALLADANANAATWVPKCGQDVIGVIYDITNEPAITQLLMIEVPYACLTCPNSCGNVSVPYSSALVATAKTTPYNFSIISGSLPPGLTLNADGTITGPPTTVGTYPFTAKVVDSSSPPQSAIVACSITIYPAVTLSCPTGTAQVGVPYSSAFVASGGSGSYTFSLSGIGKLPDGLNLNPNTGAVTGTPTNAGTFNFTAVVQDKLACGSAMQSCSITVTNTPPPPGGFGHGDTATIGFWHNKNGQALILSFNGGGSSTKLGNWFASNYPCIFGSLAGKSNSVVAAQFLTYFGVSGQKTYAQVMAGALACYATSSTLAGGSMAGGYGFNVSTGGTGAKLYNVGSNGSAIGLINNTSYPISQILQAANSKCPFGTSGTVFNALNAIFDGINQGGDIN